MIIMLKLYERIRYSMLIMLKLYRKIRKITLLMLNIYEKIRHPTLFTTKARSQTLKRKRDEVQREAIYSVGLTELWQLSITSILMFHT